MKPSPPRPPYAFAKRHGATLLEWREDAAVIAHRPDVRVEALAEMRRYCDAPITLQEMDAVAFERLLRDLYEQGGDDARQMVADMDGRVDLGSLAEELPEPEDLMESDDDAIVIRLINALLTQAVKENASDIHIEPFENRLVVRFRVDGQLRE
ncbi:MAG: type II secretion system protein GspE, partial [Xanthomonadales bacterium]|nr:type II secretion system protein GspE [Xanthomonadales bacterium]